MAYAKTCNHGAVPCFEVPAGEHLEQQCSGPHEEPQHGLLIGSAGDVTSRRDRQTQQGRVEGSGKRDFGVLLEAEAIGRPNTKD